jgi:RNA polymerase sigma factor (TIGR02999 family)
MSPITQLLEAANGGDRQAASQLLPLVYEELRLLAAARLHEEKPGQTLQATALVHEAYIRLVGDQEFEGRGHFFAAAAEAMRRILVDHARKKATEKHGKSMQRIPFDEALKQPEQYPQALIDLDEALQKLQEHEPDAARLIQMRYFAGFTHQEAADLLGISRRAADRLWLVGRTWLYQQLDDS